MVSINVREIIIRCHYNTIIAEEIGKGDIILLDKKITTNLKDITWPIFIETLLMSLLGSMDTLMLGRYSDSAVAAVGITNQIIWLINLMFGIITAGTAILLTQNIGAKSSKKDILNISGISIGVNFILGAIISILLFLGGRELLKLLNSPDELITLGTQYIDIVGGFTFVQAILMTLTAILRSHSLTKVCMKITFIMNIINVVLNYIFIFGKFGFPSLGVSGAALGTTISRIIGLIIAFVVCYKYILKDFKFKNLFPFPKLHLINIFKIGIPSAGEQISYSLSQLVITGFINTIGVESVATKSYISTLSTFAFVFAVAMGQGSSIIVGKLVGERENDAAYKVYLYALKKSLIVTIIISGALAIFSHPLLEILTDSPEIVILGGYILIVDFILEQGRTMNIVGINALRATGDVKFPVYIGIFSMWFFAVGLGYILGIKLGLGLVGMWIAFTIDECFRGVLVFSRWKNRKWENKSFIKY